MGVPDRIAGVLALSVTLAGPARAQSTALVSVGPGGLPSNGTSFVPSARAISADGRYVVFQSIATTLDPADATSIEDVYLRDLASGTTTLASATPGGTAGNNASYVGSLSADGRWIGFTSWASDLVPGDVNGHEDAFVREVATGVTRLVNLRPDGAQGNWWANSPSLSADGRHVAFASQSSDLVPGDANDATDVFVRDLVLGTTSLVSLSSAGTQGGSHSFSPSISADARYVAFASYASDLAHGDTNLRTDVFVRDLALGATTRVSVSSGGVEGDADSGAPQISADGRCVVFSGSSSTLVPGDTNGITDVFVHDLASGTTERVSVGPAGAEADHACYGTSISADGRFVAFFGAATTLVAGVGGGQVYVRDRLVGTTTVASSTGQGVPGNGYSLSGAISADGRHVAFASHATDLVPGDANGEVDVFVRDRGEPAVVAWCSGDGSAGACPCGNAGASGRGCDNSAATGGARLSASGLPSLAADTLVLTSDGELATSTSIFLQGSAAIVPAPFGDGLRCAGGSLKRLYVESAVAGVAVAPTGGDPSISARAAALGDPIPLGATRHYQTYYRDAALAFCAPPAGDSWNVGNALSAVWGP